MRILIADDSSTARLFTKKCLEIAGKQQEEFLEVATGKEAYDLIQKEKIDLLITDLTMPDMDGTELLKKLHESGKSADFPIMVITSAFNHSKERELLSYGAGAILSKPVNPSKVFAALKNLGL